MYPNQQQGYAPQQQYQQQNPGYAPQQQYSAPPAPPQGQYAQPGADAMPPQFSDGGTFTGTGMKMPAARELAGRTVVFVPISVDETNVFKGQPRPSARADLYVIDGGDLLYGSNLDEGTPATHQISTPCVFKGWTVGNGNLVAEIRAGLEKRSMPVGVIYRSSVGQKPFNLGKIMELPDNGGPRPDGPQRWQAMQTAFAGLNTPAGQQGHIPNPEPVELNPQRPGPNGAGAMQAYAASQGYTQPAPQQPWQPTYAPGQGFTATQQYQGASPSIGQMPAAPQPSAFTQAYQATAPQSSAFEPEYRATAPVSAPAAPTQAPSAPLPPAPPGFEAVWHTFTNEQRNMLLSRQAQQAPAASPVGGQPGQDGGQPPPF